LGTTLKELGRLDEAEATYKQVIALKPDFAEAHINFGELLLIMGRHSEALEQKKKGGGLISFDLSNGWFLL
jgi:hypothetical protein